MTSRLSSLLVRDGIVTVKRMERAFQRQVLFGGSLDTVLLEMNLVPEARLVQYLSLASGLPPADPGDAERLDSRAAERCHKTVAMTHEVVPLGFERDALRIMTRDPVDLRGLEDLADELGVALQPFIAAEYRFRLTFHSVYGGAPDDRWTELAARLATTPAPAPVGRSRSVVIETTPPAIAMAPVAAEAAAPTAASAQVPSRNTQPISVTALRQHRDEIEQQATARLASTPAATPEPADDVASAPVRPIDRSEAPRHHGGASRTIEMAARAGTEPLLEPPRDVSPLGVGQARAAFAAAEHRDAVFDILLRALRARVFYAGLLTVQGRAAIGRLAIVGDESEHEAIATVLVPLDVPSAFRKVVDENSPYIGPIATGDAAIDGMIRRMGGVLPPAALLMPIALRGRVVALVLGHRGADTVSISEVSELLPLAGVAADALSRIIKGKKSTGRGAGRDGEPVPIPIDDEPATDRIAVEIAAAAPTEVASGMAGLIARIESDDAADREAAMREALARPAETIELLRRHFPGKLEVGRTTGEHRRASEHGHILDLVVRLGDAAVPLIAAALGQGDATARYFAALCAADLGHQVLRRPLVERLLDDDDGVRQAAVEALLALPPGDLDQELVAARQALLGPDLERTRRAAESFAGLGDVGALPALLEVHSRGGAASEIATRALVRLSKQDFGANNKKWRQWWDRNKSRHRIEWMLEGLNHKDVEVRKTAIDDLRRMTGEYFGYHHDLGKRERENARQRWLLWWHETGRRRFLRQTAEGERHRPTTAQPRREP